ncbi:MAG: TAT-variant-translocated molybdopterin oxidoreductase, partial [Bdellovibrionales bacterium]|nr:TAT-variant-translocated molybdopterin oxidoreductase [Bdellovibrionales bacterium]
MENNNEKNKRYWKSVEEFSDQEVFNAEAEKEFLNSPLSEKDTGDGVARRDFLKLMGASLALASASCVRRPVQNIVPYANRPEGMIEGKANYYASSMFDNGHAYATIVKTREGRPIKIEGNPAFPINQGGLSARAQAHVLSLYDPDRLQQPHARLAADKDFHKRVWDIGNWEKIDEEVSKLVNEGKVGLLTATMPSPSTKAVMDDFTSTFKAKQYIYDAINHDDVLLGQKASYGQSIFPRYRLENAKYIVSIGADFLGTYGNPVEYAKGFSKNRKPDHEMSKLIVFESLMSLTGANSDYRVPVKTSNYLKVLLGLANEIVIKQGKSRYAGDSSVKEVLKKYSNAANEAGIDTALFSKIAEEMWANRGQSLVMTGGISSKTENAVDLQIAANFLNSILENDGITVDSKFHNMSYAGSDSSLSDLVNDINSGKINVVVISGVNPIYVAPPSLKLAEAFKKVKVIYSAQYMDETAEIADYILAECHPLEAWGDFEFQDGLFSIQQPTIRPLHATRPFQFNLMTWAYTLEKGPSRLKDTETWYDYVKMYWKDRIVKGSTGGKSFDDYWTELLKVGFVDQNAGARKQKSSSRSFQLASLRSIKDTDSTSGYELNLYPKIAIGDGTYNNISFLQELPDPVTKVTWDNYLTVSYKTAKSEGLKDGDVVELSVGDEKIEVPVFVQVGQDLNTLGLA